MLTDQIILYQVFINYSGGEERAAHSCEFINIKAEYQEIDDYWEFLTVMVSLSTTWPGSRITYGTDGRVFLGVSLILFPKNIGISGGWLKAQELLLLWRLYTNYGDCDFLSWRWVTLFFLLDIRAQVSTVPQPLPSGPADSLGVWDLLSLSPHPYIYWIYIIGESCPVHFFYFHSFCFNC